MIWSRKMTYLFYFLVFSYAVAYIDFLVHPKARAFKPNNYGLLALLIKDGVGFGSV